MIERCSHLPSPSINRNSVEWNGIKAGRCNEQANHTIRWANTADYSQLKSKINELAKKQNGCFENLG